MNGIEIQYLLGLFFVISSLGYTENKLTFNIVQGVAGVILIIMAILSFSLIK
jgi:hypothetical protein